MGSYMQYSLYKVQLYKINKFTKQVCSNNFKVSLIKVTVCTRTMKTVLRANFPDAVFGNSAAAAALETSLTVTTGRSTPNVMFRKQSFVMAAYL